MSLQESADGRPRHDAMLFVCRRCRPEAGDAWVREFRSRLYGLLGRDSLTVAASGCVRTCPEDGVAAVLAGPRGGCREWSVPPDVSAAVTLLYGHLTRPATANAGACKTESCGCRPSPASSPKTPVGLGNAAEGCGHG
ncbi:hypothetical protein O7599_25290 [Streptomyces sp. WMMC500]|uniref:hypothetical protein n=1 Tax=Streptomyces sp. WMMC500 TaxID=3015154 RepID=UPI00248C6F8D|nr:hypothetical protein [Streptomyces sp. WMMC500]WBB58906.1 hypothetical protein O7599_25290 [Streptomyces sp. WMMC500]